MGIDLPACSLRTVIVTVGDIAVMTAVAVAFLAVTMFIFMAMMFFVAVSFVTLLFVMIVVVVVAIRFERSAGSCREQPD